jgi:DNA repair protein RecN (Recombination protein N)
MLLSLSAKNFILIEQLDLDLSTGLHAITGETGAGKSILLDAILFCLGYKFDTSVIRHGEECCIVALEVKVPAILNLILSENAIEHDGHIIIKRQQFTNGRKKIFVNDQIVTQKVIEQLAEHLVEIHGQNSHSSLLNPSAHLDIVDSYGKLEDKRAAISNIFKEWQAKERGLQEIEKERKFLEREIDYLSFVVNELQELDVKEGEEQELAALRIDMQLKEKSKVLVRDIYSALTDNPIDTQILAVGRIINRGDKDGLFSDVLESLEHALIHLDAATKTIESKMRDDEFIDVDAVEERLFAIRAIARKHNIAPDAIPSFFKASAADLAALQSKIIAEENLKEDIVRLSKEYASLAAKLSSERKSVALALEEKIAGELGYLKMGGAIFKIEFQNLSLDKALSSGLDGVRFIASTNPGTAAAPIEKIASGGELSRFMLAIKVALFDKFTKPTIIFDEVDTGIGGMVADAVGERLKFIGKASQVIVITHQPQVAGKADNHIFVFKSHKDNNTFSNAKHLSGEEKLEEIARMISGESITDVAREAAKELLR